MKAFLFSDLHCSNKQLSNLYDFVIQNKDIEALIFAGDVVNMGEPVWFMEKFIKVIDELKLPLLWVPGNNDFGRAYHKLNARYKSLEGRVVELVLPLTKGKLDGVDKMIRRFTGVGGSPASWAGQYEGESMIDQKEIAGSIFVSHVPPPANIKLKQFDVGKLANAPAVISTLRVESSTPSVISTPRWQSGAEKSPIKRSLRSGRDDKSLYDIRYTTYEKRRFSNSPLVHICGHLHYKWGTAFLGQTKIIQLASLETGHYAIMDLETLAVKFERF